MDLGITGKRAVVAASTSGLGLATAVALADAGCTVVVNGRTEERLAAAVPKVAGSIPIAGDLSTREGAETFIDAAAEALGGIDILITNAGGPPPGNFAQTDITAYAAALEMNLVSMAAMCKKVVPGMQAQHWGRIVAITSTSVHTPMPNLILSNTARSGLTSLLKTLALEVVGDGITVNTVAPGPIQDTEMFEAVVPADSEKLVDMAASIPVKRLGRSIDVAHAVDFLADEASGFITGQTLMVCGGASLGSLAL